MAYNAFLALVPLALALIGIASFLGQDDKTLARVERAMEPIAPRAVTDFVLDLLRETDERVGDAGVWLILASIFVALFLGSRAVVAMQKALAAVENETEVRPAVQMRLVAVGLTIGGGLALIATSFLLVAGRTLVRVLADISGLGALEAVWVWVRIPVSAAGLYVFLLGFYHWGPPRPLPKAWLAAAVAGGGVVLISLGFGWYLSAAPELGATFGVLGAVAVALVWLYLGAVAILLGAVAVAYTLRWRSSR